MTFQLDDTIAALASPAGPACRGIIRLSGPLVRDVLDPLFEPARRDCWLSSKVARRHPGLLTLPELRAPLPVDLYLWPHARSYTGQPAAELHTLGSPPLLEAVLTALHRNGARPARPGEFTLRAFLAGRIDLTQAEAVLGVIDAHDHVELETALRQLAGGLSGPIAEVRDDLTGLAADLEAGLDFVDEDIEFISRRDLMARLKAAGDAIGRLLRQASRRLQTTVRRQVVLAGLPNAGKSTLFNALAGREAALVSEIGGTTRDYLSAECRWNGLPVELIDTAGWERAAEGITSQAQILGSARIAQADLIVWCTACDVDADTLDADRQLFQELMQQDRPMLPVQTKCDRRAAVAAYEGFVNTEPSQACPKAVGRLRPPAKQGTGHRFAAGLAPHSSEQLAPTAGRPGPIRTSAATGTGLEELIERAVAVLGARAAGGRELLGTTASRCRESLEQAAAALQRAEQAAHSGSGDEIVSIDVRDALDHLGRILGAVYTDDILDRIFTKFCIGK